MKVLRDRFCDHSSSVLLLYFLGLNISILPSPAANSHNSAVAGSQELYSEGTNVQNYRIIVIMIIIVEMIPLINPLLTSNP